MTHNAPSVLPVQHDGGWSHTEGLVCTDCHPDKWPAYSKEYVARLHDRIDAALAISPEDHATKSRDYGRGFAEAIRQVREALNTTS